MNRTARYTKGSVVLDRRRGTWNYFFYQDGKRRSKLVGTKKAVSDEISSAARC